jgi:hypothetical protein
MPCVGFWIRTLASNEDCTPEEKSKEVFLCFMTESSVHIADEILRCTLIGFLVLGLLAVVSLVLMGFFAGIWEIAKGCYHMYQIFAKEVEDEENQWKEIQFRKSI